MAYFPNSDAGHSFDEQCGRCKYGETSCPIALAQYTFNYEACNNKTARNLLDGLVSNEGVCAMFAMDPQGFSKEPRTVNAKRLHALRQIAKTDGIGSQIAKAVLSNPGPNSTGVSRGGIETKGG